MANRPTIHTLTTANADLQKKYDKLVKGVTELIMNHESCEGCMSGKIEALEVLGLPVPNTNRVVTIEIQVTDPYLLEEDDTGEIEYQIENAIERYGSGFTVESVEVKAAS